MNVGLARGLPGRPEQRPRADSRALGRAGRRRGRLRARASTRDTPRPVGDRCGASRCPTLRGWTTAEMIAHAAAGDVDAFWIVGGNFLETLPDDARSRARARAAAPAHPPGHRAVVVDAGRRATATRCSCRRRRATNRRAAARRRRPNGASSSRRRFPGRRIGSARPEWQVFRDVMRRARPERRVAVGLEDAAAIRAGDRARRAALRRHRAAGGQGRSRCSGAAAGSTPTAGSPRPTAGRTSRRSRLRGRDRAADGFVVSTRRGKQFNSMVQRDVDPLTGAARDDILISAGGPGAARAGGGRPRAAAIGARRVHGPAAAAPDPRRQPRGALARGQRAAVGRGARSRVDGARLQRHGHDRAVGRVPGGARIDRGAEPPGRRPSDGRYRPSMYSRRKPFS